MDKLITDCLKTIANEQYMPALVYIAVRDAIKKIDQIENSLAEANQKIEKLKQELIQEREGYNNQLKRTNRLSEWLAEANGEIAELLGKLSQCNREMAKLRAEKIPRVID